MPFLSLGNARRSTSFSTGTDTTSLKAVGNDRSQNVSSAPPTSTSSLRTPKYPEHISTEKTASHFKMDAIKKVLTERKPSKSPKLLPKQSARIEMQVESPPLVSHNTPAHSTGALFSAQLDVIVTEPETIFKSFQVQLHCTVVVKKPVYAACPECTTDKTEMKTWNFTEHDKLVLKEGHHKFPLSYLFAGHLPTTTHASLITLDYHLSAVAKTTHGETITFNKPLQLSRAVLPGDDRHTLRVFPPTTLAVNVGFNSIIHPIGEFPVTLSLSGMNIPKENSIQRWRLRKLDWRIRETQEMISPACPKHAAKLGGAGKGIQHEEARNIGEGEVKYRKTPWKYDGDKGEVEAEFTCMVDASKHPVCDVEAPNGMRISHDVMLEMVVAEEWSSKDHPKQLHSTGAARILRCNFHVLLTERAGLGISWDEETPPIYQDVPASPPGYGSMAEVDLDDIVGTIEDFHLDVNTEAVSNTMSSSSRPPHHLRSSSSGNQAGPSRMRNVITIDDLMSEPVLTRSESTQEEEDEEDGGEGQVIQS